MIILLYQAPPITGPMLLNERSGCTAKKLMHFCAVYKPLSENLGVSYQQRTTRPDWYPVPYGHVVYRVIVGQQENEIEYLRWALSWALPYSLRKHTADTINNLPAASTKKIHTLLTTPSSRRNHPLTCLINKPKPSSHSSSQGEKTLFLQPLSLKYQDVVQCDIGYDQNVL